MYHLFTCEMIDGTIEDISCGYYRNIRDAEYAASSDYKDVRPLYLSFPNGTEITIRKPQ